jgi:hypothetical protein
MGAGSEDIASEPGISGTGASSFFWQPTSTSASNAAIRAECSSFCFISPLLPKKVLGANGRPARFEIGAFHRTSIGDA